MRSLAFGIVALAVFAILTVMWCVADAREQYASVSWPTAQATVTKSEIADWDLVLEYEFHTDRDIIRTSSRRLPRASAYYWRMDRVFVRNHPVGSTIKVWYNPENPQRATLVPGLSWLDIAPVVGTLIAIALMAVGIWRKIRRRVVDGKGPLL